MQNSAHYGKRFGIHTWKILQDGQITILSSGSACPEKLKNCTAPCPCKPWEPWEPWEPWRFLLGLLGKTMPCEIRLTEGTTIRPRRRLRRAIEVQSLEIRAESAFREIDTDHSLSSSRAVAVTVGRPVDQTCDGTSRAK